MKKNKLSKYFIFVSCLTLFSVFVVVVQSSYSKLIGPSQTVQSDSSLNPIDLEINFQTVVDIKKRQEFLPEQLNQFFVPTPLATNSADANLPD